MGPRLRTTPVFIAGLTVRIRFPPAGGQERTGATGHPRPCPHAQPRPRRSPDCAGVALIITGANLVEAKLDIMGVPVNGSDRTGRRCLLAPFGLAQTRRV